MRENWNGSEQHDDRTPREIIRSRIEMLAAVFSKKISEELIIVWQEALDGYPISAIKAGFTKAERSLEKFPTPKIMRELCKENMPSQAWRYHFEPVLKNDPETSKPVRALLDPDPDCRNCRNPRSQHPFSIIDKKGEVIGICQEYTGQKDDNVMYRAQDCPEGREFLATLREIAKK